MAGAGRTMDPHPMTAQVPHVATIVILVGVVLFLVAVAVELLTDR